VKSPVISGQEAGWALEAVWTLCALAGNQTPIPSFPACALVAVLIEISRPVFVIFTLSKSVVEIQIEPEIP
jgi:hypothetical protein